jgi:hypothetical protein
MTAGTRAYVSCDQHDPSKPPGHEDHLCDAIVERGATTAQARSVARQLGWLVRVTKTGEEPPKGRRWGLRDFCPQHRPAKPQEAKTSA